MAFPTLKSIIEDNETRTGRVFDLFIQALIIISLISFSLETLPDLSPTFATVLHWIEVITVLIFSVEYLARVWVATKARQFIFSFWGIIDLCAILPFYISSGVDLRSIRTLRLLRVFRSLRLVRYNRALRKYFRAFAMMKAELGVFAIITSFVLFLSATGIYYFEREAQPDVFQSVFHSLWWAVTTLTTVGYGDQYPITVGGRIFTSFVVLLGIGVISVPSALLASTLSSLSKENDKDGEK